MFGTLLVFLAEHWELVELLYNAITTGKLTKQSATKALNDAMVAASDAQMQKEFPT